MVIGLTAVFLRCYQLGSLPPGLYRDEAFNGFDAVRVLHGEHSLFFPANNGREPIYIYLVAAAVGVLGQTAVALRLPAAIVGSLATFAVYKLADSWFGRGVGLLTAWLWATTFWPLHLGRIGLRVGLLPPFLALTFWLATLAYRRQQRWLWLAAGAVYGLSFYSYLAVRFTPLLLLMGLLYLLWRGGWRRLWPGVGWFVLATAVCLLPLLLLAWQNPALFAGRAGQVSVLNPAINGGDLLGALWRKGWQALGMFVWRGDPILRHNGLNSYPGGNGRAVFDLFMAVPFLLGVWVCLRQWRQPPFGLTLLWTVVMLGPTMLAEDTPHFLRAVGVLPAVLLLPALGLQAIWQGCGAWGNSPHPTPHSPHPTPHTLSRAIVALLLAGSFGLTLRDYLNYGRQPTVAYLFEDGARRLAEEVVGLPPETAVYLDEQFRNGWPSIPFLLADRPVNWFATGEVPQGVGGQTAVYLWPYGSVDGVAELARPPARLVTAVGPLVRGDLEATAYPLYFGYTVTAVDPLPEPVAVFANGTALAAAVATVQDGQVVVDLTWAAETAVSSSAAFVHVVAPDGLLGQADAPLGGVAWRADWWRPGLLVVERRLVGLERPFDPSQHHIFVGLYDSQSGERLPLAGTGADSWEIHVSEEDYFGQD